MLMKKLSTHTFSITITTVHELFHSIIEYLELFLVNVVALIIFSSQVIDEVTNFLTKGKSRLSLPEKTTVLDMLTSGNQVITNFLLRHFINNIRMSNQL